MNEQTTSDRRTLVRAGARARQGNEGTLLWTLLIAVSIVCAPLFLQLDPAWGVGADSQPPGGQRDPNRLWCREHGVYEDECLICHPELAEPESPSGTQAKRDPNRLWCREHDVYEDECVICHPELGKPESPSVADAASGRASRLFCNEHRVPEIECGICQPQLASSLGVGEGMKVRLPSPNSASKAGIRAARPRVAEAAASFSVFCEVRYNQNRLARITPLASGVVHTVSADPGDTVSAGQTLVEIASAEVAAAKRDYLVALVDRNVKQLALSREKELIRKEISSLQSLQQAEAEHEMAAIAVTTARQRLLNFGFSESEIEQIERTKSSSSLLPVRAPFDGTVVDRLAVIGEAVDPGVALFTLANLSTMWLTLSVPEARAGLIRVGQMVEATFAALPGMVARGELIWVRPAVSEPVRMVEARAIIPNPDGLLRNNLFGSAKVLLDSGASALIVPRQAVQRFERRPFVFVEAEDDLYELRHVELGANDGPEVQVLGGLRSDERVVVVGSYTLLSEFLKSRLGAGCVDE